MSWQNSSIGDNKPVNSVPNMTVPKLVVYIVRHGRTDHNQKRILQGHLDTDLNDEGREQARKVGERLAQVKFDYVLSSDLKRCVQTAQEILKHQHGAVYETTDQIRERNMGVIEGMQLDDAIAYGEKHGKHFRDFGEQKADFLRRVYKKWDETIDKSIANGYSTICLVSHGGVISNFTNHLVNDLGYKLDDSITLEQLKVPYNTSVTIVEVDTSTKKGTIVSFGDTSHLGGQFTVANQLLR